MAATDTICALSSAPGRAGVAVVRVSGPGANAALEALTGRLPPPRKASARTIRTPDTGEEVDRAIVLRFEGPSSFTGEDVVEIHPHGGRAVVESILRALLAAGCRLAEPGEFARRAFENGKIDLTEAEGIADLIDAETQAQHRQAVRQATGALSKLYEGWRQEIISAMALMEAAIDFSDEADVAANACEQARLIASELAPRLEAHLADGRRGEILRDGYRVVLAGAPNVGKSSLLNALARRDVAIVSAVPGTTRDVIEVRLDLDGLAVIVSDTAGIREAEGEIEQEGIRRTLATGQSADLMIWMTDVNGPAGEIPGELTSGDRALLRAINKSDLLDVDQMVGKPDENVLVISALTGEGLPLLVAEIGKRARDAAGGGQDVGITRVRHRQAVEDCVRRLQDFRLGDVSQVELRAEDLRQAANALGWITGKVDAETVLDQVFGRFCIGK